MLAIKLVSQHTANQQQLLTAKSYQPLAVLLLIGEAPAGTTGMQAVSAVVPPSEADWGNAWLSMHGHQRLTHIKYVGALILSDCLDAVKSFVKAGQPKCVNGLAHACLAHVNRLMLRYAVQYLHQPRPHL